MAYPTFNFSFKHLGRKRVSWTTVNWKEKWQQWHLRYTTRRQLAKLTAEQLADIGITVEQAQKEIAEPFWK